MVNQFILDLQPKHLKRSKSVNVIRPGRELAKTLSERCNGCYSSDCWPLKEGNENGQMYLPHYYFANAKRGRYVQIKQVLFQIAYNEPVPRGRKIHNYCETHGCMNPGHFYVRGWRPDAVSIHDLIDRRGWLTDEQALEWQFKNSKEIRKDIKPVGKKAEA